MKSNLINNLKELIGVSGEASLSGLAPIIGEAIQSMKINRLSKRLNASEEKIFLLSNKVQTIDDEKFVILLKEFLFPSILQNLLDEDEDEKTGLFLDGFDSVIDKRITKESKILIYYDILKGLRFIEIEHLISLTQVYQFYKIYQAKHSIEKSSNNIDSINIRDSTNLIFAIENKLESLGLIDTGRYEQIIGNLNQSIKNHQVGMMTSHLGASKPRSTVTTFGNDFLEFFYLLDKFKV